eukprot:TRINITY_DN25557_c0_g1_i1.p1 TRINITY_DN25557_c0_g1~~TRINITY_DN25557_c0_g1_i1.p1  ORF type:complete len:2366 (+),score=564.10 TRINITY_DN25557_c0_g1_i1:83-7180(+)
MGCCFSDCCYNESAVNPDFFDYAAKEESTEDFHLTVMTCVNPFMPMQYGLKDLVFEVMLDTGRYCEWVPEFQNVGVRVQGNPTMKGAVYTCGLPSSMDAFPENLFTQHDLRHGPMNMVIVAVDRANVVDPKTGAEGIPTALLSSVGPVLPPRFGAKVRFSVACPRVKVGIDIEQIKKAQKGLGMALEGMLAPYKNRHADGSKIFISLSAVRVNFKVTIEAHGHGNAKVIAEKWRGWFAGPYKRALEDHCKRMLKKTNGSIGWMIRPEDDKRYLKWNKTTMLDKAFLFGGDKDNSMLDEKGKVTEGPAGQLIKKLKDFAGQIGGATNELLDKLTAHEEDLEQFYTLATGSDFDQMVADLQTRCPVPANLDWKAAIADAAAGVAPAPVQEVMRAEVGERVENFDAEQAVYKAAEGIDRALPSLLQSSSGASPRKQQADVAVVPRSTGFVVTNHSNPLPPGAPRGKFRGTVHYDGKFRKHLCNPGFCFGPYGFDNYFDIEFDTDSVKYSPDQMSFQVKLMRTKGNDKGDSTFLETYEGKWEPGKSAWTGKVTDGLRIYGQGKSTVRPAADKLQLIARDRCWELQDPERAVTLWPVSAPVMYSAHISAIDAIRSEESQHVALMWGDERLLQKQETEPEEGDGGAEGDEEGGFKWQVELEPLPKQIPKFIFVPQYEHRLWYVYKAEEYHTLFEKVTARDTSIVDQAFEGGEGAALAAVFNKLKGCKRDGGFWCSICRKKMKCSEPGKPCSGYFCHNRAIKSSEFQREVQNEAGKKITVHQRSFAVCLPCARQHCLRYDAEDHESPFAMRFANGVLGADGFDEHVEDNDAREVNRRGNDKAKLAELRKGKAGGFFSGSSVAFNFEKALPKLIDDLHKYEMEVPEGPDSCAMLRAFGKKVGDKDKKDLALKFLDYLKLPEGGGSWFSKLFSTEPRSMTRCLAEMRFFAIHFGMYMYKPDLFGKLGCFMDESGEPQEALAKGQLFTTDDAFQKLPKPAQMMIDVNYPDHLAEIEFKWTGIRVFDQLFKEVEVPLIASIKARNDVFDAYDEALRVCRFKGELGAADLSAALKNIRTKMKAGGALSWPPPRISDNGGTLRFCTLAGSDPDASSAVQEACRVYANFWDMNVRLFKAAGQLSQYIAFLGTVGKVDSPRFVAMAEHAKLPAEAMAMMNQAASGKKGKQAGADDWLVEFTKHNVEAMSATEKEMTELIKLCGKFTTSIYSGLREWKAEWRNEEQKKAPNGAQDMINFVCQKTRGHDAPQEVLDVTETLYPGSKKGLEEKSRRRLIAFLKGFPEISISPDESVIWDAYYPDTLVDSTEFVDCYFGELNSVFEDISGKVEAISEKRMSIERSLVDLYYRCSFGGMAAADSVKKCVSNLAEHVKKDHKRAQIYYWIMGGVTADVSESAVSSEGGTKMYEFVVWEKPEGLLTMLVNYFLSRKPTEVKISAESQRAVRCFEFFLASISKNANQLKNMVSSLQNTIQQLTLDWMTADNFGGKSQLDQMLEDQNVDKKACQQIIDNVKMNIRQCEQVTKSLAAFEKELKAITTDSHDAIHQKKGMVGFSSSLLEKGKGNGSKEFLRSTTPFEPVKVIKDFVEKVVESKEEAKRVVSQIEAELGEAEEVANAAKGGIMSSLGGGSNFKFESPLQRRVFIESIIAAGKKLAPTHFKDWKPPADGIFETDASPEGLMRTFYGISGLDDLPIIEFTGIADFDKEYMEAAGPFFDIIRPLHDLQNARRAFLDAVSEAVGKPFVNGIQAINELKARCGLYFLEDDRHLFEPAEGAVLQAHRRDVKELDEKPRVAVAAMVTYVNAMEQAKMALQPNLDKIRSVQQDIMDNFDTIMPEMDDILKWDPEFDFPNLPDKPMISVDLPSYYSLGLGFGLPPLPGCQAVELPTLPLFPNIDALLGAYVKRVDFPHCLGDILPAFKLPKTQHHLNYHWTYSVPSIKGIKDLSSLVKFTSPIAGMSLGVSDEMLTMVKDKATEFAKNTIGKLAKSLVMDITFLSNPVTAAFQTISNIYALAKMAAKATNKAHKMKTSRTKADLAEKNKQRASNDIKDRVIANARNICSFSYGVSLLHTGVNSEWSQLHTALRSTGESQDNEKKKGNSIKLPKPTQTELDVWLEMARRSVHNGKYTGSIQFGGLPTKETLTLTIQDSGDAVQGASFKGKLSLAGDDVAVSFKGMIDQGRDDEQAKKFQIECSVVKYEWIQLELETADAEKLKMKEPIYLAEYADNKVSLMRTDNGQYLGETGEAQQAKFAFSLEEKGGREGEPWVNSQVKAGDLTIRLKAAPIEIILEGTYLNGKFTGSKASSRRQVGDSPALVSGPWEVSKTDVDDAVDAKKPFVRVRYASDMQKIKRVAGLAKTFAVSQ